jgi:alkylation response protein AidB-like acyl-CoA dehydrogenase
MDFALSEERQMLKDTAERFVRERYPIETRHAATKSEAGFDRALWAEFCELGLVGALIPAEHGGFGGTGEDIALVFEAVGRGLVVEPFLPTLLASVPLAAHGMTDALEAAMEGRTLLSFAHYEPDSRYDANRVGTRAVERDGKWELTGRKAVVINGATADLIVVSARLSGAEDAEGGLALFNVSPNAPGVEVRGFAGIDGPHVAELTFENGHCHPLGDPGEEAWPIIEKTLAAGALAVSAEAIGIMDVCRDGTLAYLKERKQFGRPIGANQALQHRMVDMMLEIEQARSAVMLAANTLEAPRVERELNVSAAKNLVGRTGRLVAEEAIQMHGGVAMTWEWPLAHYAKRLVMIDHLFGDTDHHLQRYIALSRDADAPKVENATPGSDNPSA